MIAGKSAIDLSSLSDSELHSWVPPGLEYIKERNQTEPEYTPFLLPLLERQEVAILFPLLQLLAKDPMGARGGIAAHAHHRNDDVRLAAIQSLNAIDQLVPIVGGRLQDPELRETALAQLLKLRGDDIADEKIALQLYRSLAWSLNDGDGPSSRADAAKDFASQLDKSLSDMGYGSDDCDLLQRLLQHETVDELPSPGWHPEAVQPPPLKRFGETDRTQLTRVVILIFEPVNAS